MSLDGVAAHDLDFVESVLIGLRLALPEPRAMVAVGGGCSARTRRAPCRNAVNAPKGLCISHFIARYGHQYASSDYQFTGDCRIITCRLCGRSWGSWTASMTQEKRAAVKAEEHAAIREFCKARIDPGALARLLVTIEAVDVAHLNDSLKNDPAVPFLVWRGYEKWLETFLVKAPDSEFKELKTALAREITDLVEEDVKPQLGEAMVRALCWRSPAQLEAAKAVIVREKEAGNVPRLRGRESCLFLECGGTEESPEVCVQMCPDMMLSLTLHEPWATLMAIGAKRIETRGWDIAYRGPVAIHAAKGGLTRIELESVCRQPEFFAALKQYEPFHETAHFLAGNLKSVFPFGHIIAVGNLTDCVRTEAYRCALSVFDEYPELNTPAERAFGNYDTGRYGFVFTDMVRLKTPVPFKSRQGKLIPLDAVTERLVREQL